METDTTHPQPRRGFVLTADPWHVPNSKSITAAIATTRTVSREETALTHRNTYKPMGFGRDSPDNPRALSDYRPTNPWAKNP